jgi:hypothetical protein
MSAGAALLPLIKIPSKVANKITPAPDGRNVSS